MKITQVLTSSTLVSLSLAQSNTTVTCQSGLHVIVARASGERPGFGILDQVKDEILSRVPNSDAIAVPYPATIVNPIYFESQPAGVGNLTLLIKQYGDACPDSKMALLGYSQGAHVVGDTLIGVDYPGITGFPNATAIDAKYRENIVAVIMMGDPANIAGQSILVGNSTRNGTFPRGNANNWESENLADKVQSYCDAEDTYCDSGRANNSLAVHVGYVFEYGRQAADFVVSKALENNITTTPSNTTTTSGTSISTTAAPSGTSTSDAETTTGSNEPTSASAGSSPTATGTTPPNSATAIGHSLGSYLAAGVVSCMLAFAMVY